MSEQKNDAFIEQRESIAAIVAERDELRELLHEAIEAMKSNEHEYEELIEKIKAKHGEMK